MSHPVLLFLLKSLWDASTGKAKSDFLPESHTVLPQSQTHIMLGSSPSCPCPYGQMQFKVQPTLLETVTEVKKAEQE